MRRDRGRPARSSGPSPGSRRSIAPGTSSSRAHSSGTESSPRRRAATAGNSAFEVVGAGEHAADDPLRARARCARAARASAPRSRRGSRRRRCSSALTAPRGPPRVARSSLIGAASFQSRSTSGGRSRRASPSGSVAERAASRTGPRRGATTWLPTASTIRRTWRLRPSRSVSSTTRGETRRTRAGAVGPSSSSTPLRSRRSWLG